MKTNNVEIIKADSLVRRRGVNIERHLKRVAAYCRVRSDSEYQKNSYESQMKYYKVTFLSVQIGNSLISMQMREFQELK